MIPRHLHFIYLNEPIPANRQACIDSCIAKHPGWDVTVWTSLEQFGLLRNRRAFFAADQIAPPPPRGNRWQVVSNILRFEIMARFGGVYIDSDCFCHRPLDDILESAEAQGKAGVLGWEVQDRWLGEAVIACEPGAAFMEKIVANLEPWAFARKGQAATKTVGPQYITPLLVGSPELEDVLLMDQEVFFPAAYNQPDRADALVNGLIPLPDKTRITHRFGNFRRRRGMVWA